MSVESHTPTPPRPALSRRQAEVLGAISGHLRERGCPPTIRELGRLLGLRSTSAVANHLAALERKGYLDKQSHKSRTWRPVDGPARAAAVAQGGPLGTAAKSAPRMVPWVGEVMAGQPALAIEEAGETLAIDPALLPRRCRDVFALGIVGSSMVDAGMAPGDVVLVERRDHAPAGAIVVALLGDEATVKRYRPNPATRQVVLEPANAAMAPIVLGPDEAASLRIVGVVVGVWRRLD